ncbi:MAG: hypothetical protein HY901_38340 [Deltaproteobacteria bacterium]|nr:hypothetical protein [Deltaproteobacteria bacterium]
MREGVRITLVMHGTQVASWDEGETAIRNALLVQLAEEPRIVLEDLAKAFQLSSETVRLLRRKAEREGVLAVMLPSPPGRAPLAPELRARMEKLFEEGKRNEEVRAELDCKVASSTVSKYRKKWDAQRREAPPPEATQQPLPLPSVAVQAEQAPAETQKGSEGETPRTGPTDAGPEATHGEFRAPRQESEYRSGSPLREEAPETAAVERRGAKVRIEAVGPRSRRSVQHLGAWLLVAMAKSLGLHDDAQALLSPKSRRPFRVALDALISALAIGEGCVEGVRRLSTRTCTSLLLSSAAPSATWIRRALGSVAEEAEGFHERFAANLIRAANAAAEPGRPVVFYVDNHTREYTGEQELTWHWKMQDDRAVPGVTDYWIHDTNGNPIAPITAFQQASLVEYLPRCASLLRGALGEEPPVLVAFDRGGAFPTAMVDLKTLPEGKVDFLTYERAPFRKHGRKYFKRHGETVKMLDCEGKEETVLVIDGGKYLGDERGRVRRLSLLMPDDAQLNLLTSSDEDAAWLAQILFARWRQENAFKFGGERWGFDQLDSRQVEPYPAGTLIPNPYRRNLERSRDDLAEREGKLRCQIARLKAGDQKRLQLKAKLADVLETKADVMKALYNATEKIFIERTHLAETLVHHRREYKILVDTVRIGCATAEDRLARMLAEHLPRFAEAKRVIQNMLKAPGNVCVTPDKIAISLDPSGNRSELHALRALLKEVNALSLTHPGDPMGRSLCFALQ